MESACALSSPKVPRSAFTLLDPIEGEPATVLAALPRRAGFRRSFTRAALSRRQARPLLVIHALFARGERGRTPPVDFCNRCDPRARPRPPELRSTTPAVARWCSFALGAHHLAAMCRAADGRAHLRERASRDFTGQGPFGDPKVSRWLLPPRSLAVEALPQPDRLGHPLSHAGDDPPPGDVDVVGSFHSRYRCASLSRRSRVGAPPKPTAAGFLG